MQFPHRPDHRVHRSEPECPRSAAWPSPIPHGRRACARVTARLPGPAKLDRILNPSKRAGFRLNSHSSRI